MVVEVDGVGAAPGPLSVLGSGGEAMRDAVRNKESCNRRRTPTQDLSTNNWGLDATAATRIDSGGVWGQPEDGCVFFSFLGIRGQKIGSARAEQLF